MKVKTTRCEPPLGQGQHWNISKILHIYVCIYIWLDGFTPFHFNSCMKNKMDMGSSVGASVMFSSGATSTVVALVVTTSGGGVGGGFGGGCKNLHYIYAMSF